MFSSYISISCKRENVINIIKKIFLGCTEEDENLLKNSEEMIKILFFVDEKKIIKW